MRGDSDSIDTEFVIVSDWATPALRALLAVPVLCLGVYLQGHSPELYKLAVLCKFLSVLLVLGLPSAILRTLDRSPKLLVQTSRLAAPSSMVTFSGTAKLVSFASTSQWPPAAYIGVQEGPNRNNSLQVLAIRNRPTDDYLVVGYRLVVGAKEVKVESIVNVPLNSVLKVRIEFAGGSAILHVNDERAIEVATPFKEVAPYVSVSSGEAEFGVDL